MDAARWKLVRHHFEHLIDLPAAARVSILDALPDADLRAEVERLLARHEENTSAIDRPAAQLVAGALAGGASERDWDREQIGRRVGPYLLDDLLGTGGMGTVYRASRVEGGFEQVVAVKLLLTAHPNLRERFRNEQDILAGLNHPNIAQLVDGGETQDGIPFLAMEFVDGVPITEFCRDHLPEVTARIRLLLKVAAALSHAHRNLVVHRDIKPTNILVTHQDGRPKLLDFGIAKLMGEQRFGNLTQQKLGPMTPAFAAPEQFTGGAISVATDVYQFGVLLFRLITGRLPYEADVDDPMAWGRAVLEHEPLTLGRALTSVRRAQAGNTARDAVHTLSHEINRDLDAIVRTCLNKDPARRYGSMDALIADLEAFLAGRPVQARRGGKLYHLSRFVSRHRWSVGLGCAALLGLIALTAFSLVQWRIAQQQARRAQLSAQFMEEVLKAADPWQGKGGVTTAIDLMDTATAVMQSELSNYPELGDPTAIQIANAYANLGAINRAWPIYQRTIDSMRQQNFPPLEFAAALERAAFTAQREGRLEIANQWLEELEPLLKGESEPVVRIRDGMLHTRWYILRDGGKAHEALGNAEYRLKILQPHKDSMPDLWLTAMGRYATSLIDTGQYGIGEAKQRETHALAVKLFGENHGRSLMARQTLGWSLNVVGKPEDSLAVIEPLEDKIRTVFGQNSQNMGAHWHNRGNAYRSLERLDDALRAYRAAADSYRFSTNPSSPQVGYALWNVGGVLDKQGHWKEALAEYQMVEASWDQSLSKDAPIRAELYMQMAGLQTRLKQYRESLAHLEKAIPLLQQHEPESEKLAQAHAHMALNFSEIGSIERAITQWRTALKILPSHPGTEQLRQEWTAQINKFEARP